MKRIYDKIDEMVQKYSGTFLNIKLRDGYKELVYVLDVVEPTKLYVHNGRKPFIADIKDLDEDVKELGYIFYDPTNNREERLFDERVLVYFQRIPVRRTKQGLPPDSLRAVQGDAVLDFKRNFRGNHDNYSRFLMHYNDNRIRPYILKDIKGNIIYQILSNYGAGIYQYKEDICLCLKYLTDEIVNLKVMYKGELMYVSTFRTDNLNKELSFSPKSPKNVTIGIIRNLLFKRG